MCTLANIERERGTTNWVRYKKVDENALKLCRGSNRNNNRHQCTTRNSQKRREERQENMNREKKHAQRASERERMKPKVEQNMQKSGIRVAKFAALQRRINRKCAPTQIGDSCNMKHHSKGKTYRRCAVIALHSLVSLHTIFHLHKKRTMVVLYIFFITAFAIGIDSDPRAKRKKAGNFWYASSFSLTQSDSFPSFMIHSRCLLKYNPSLVRVSLRKFHYFLKVCATARQYSHSRALSPTLVASSETKSRLIFSFVFTHANGKSHQSHQIKPLRPSAYSHNRTLCFHWLLS